MTFEHNNVDRLGGENIRAQCNLQISGIKLTLLKIFTFICSTSWRPELLA